MDKSCGGSGFIEKMLIKRRRLKFVIKKNQADLKRIGIKKNTCRTKTDSRNFQIVRA